MTPAAQRAERDRVKRRRVRTLRDFQVRQHPSFRGEYMITARTPSGWQVQPNVYHDLDAALAVVDQMRRTHRLVTAYFGGSVFSVEE